MMYKRNSLILMYTEFLFILVLASSTTLIGYSQTIIKTLPGYPGPLPFKLETGYIGVGEDEVVQLFYYFVESERNPEEDPLVIWLAGGPGCVALRGMFFGVGPIQVKPGNYTDEVPTLQPNLNSWTKVANVIYLDAPTITGFSYTKTPKAVQSSDTSSSSQTAEFLRKFVRYHPKFLKNPLYVAGISYSGIVIPMITEILYTGNDEGLEPNLNVKGYIAGNPLTDRVSDIDSRLEYAYRVGFITKKLFEDTKKNCNGKYAEADFKNLSCMSNIDEVNKRISRINIQQILDPNCDPRTTSISDAIPIERGNHRERRLNPIEMAPLQSPLNDTGVYYDYVTLWANDKNVMKALNIREGTLEEWLICNSDMRYIYGRRVPLYEFDVLSSVEYHEKLSKRNCRALIFSGDHDMMVPYVATENWITSLNLTIKDSNWEAWYVNGQNAGYKTIYARDNYSLEFVTVKGAGHTVYEFKPKELVEMVKRWLVYMPI